MNILHWYPSFPSGGGVTNAVLGLARAQSELGHNVTIAASKTDATPVYGTQVAPTLDVVTWRPIYTFQLGRRKLRILGTAAHRLLQAVNPDVIHIHGEFNVDNLWAPRVFRAPIVLSPHGGFHPAVLQKSCTRLKRTYVCFAQKTLYRKVAAFHASCPAERSHISALVPGAPVYCVPLGAEPKQPASDKPCLPRQGTIKLLFVGRMDVYTKGLDILLEAFALALRSAASPMLLHLVGPDWDNGVQRLNAHAARLGVRDQIIFHGARGRDDVAGFMGKSDIYIQLSRHDGFSLSVAEALLCGNPAILSENVGIASSADIGSLPHVQVVRPVPEEASGAIVQVTSNLEQLRSQAASTVEKLRSFFSWSRIADAHCKQYSTLRLSAASAAKLAS
jgi:glycosyltransferase involved in cell wall biosynthesis